MRRVSRTGGPLATPTTSLIQSIRRLIVARSYPAPDAFPGMRPEGWTSGGTNPDTPSWAVDREPDDRDYDVPTDPALSEKITPGGNMITDAGVKSAPNPIPATRAPNPVAV